jgi:hypothetical protein
MSKARTLVIIMIVVFVAGQLVVVRPFGMFDGN